MEPLAEHRESVADHLAGVVASSEDGFTRSDALRALGAWHTGKVIPAMVRCLEDEQAVVRWAAFDALAKIQTPEAAEAVAKALVGKERMRASQTLKAMGSVAEAAVLGYVGHDDRHVRLEAIRILGDIGTKAKSIPVLRKLLKHRDLTLRTQAKLAGRAILARERR
jgi:HEAT repeat protein